MTHAELARTYDAWAAEGRAEEMEARSIDVTRQVLATLAVKPGMQLLDLGCGGGWAARLLGKLAPGAQAIGIDVSPGMIAKAEALSDWTSRARFECMAFEALTFSDRKFDRVVAVEALDHAVDLASAVRELHRVTKPGGTVDVLLERYHESPATEDFAVGCAFERAWLGEGDWCAALHAGGFADAAPKRLFDTRGPGAPALSWIPTAGQTAALARGTLWVRAVRP
jgi:ubiquinone/menaquinone biosynthesis C-methylase UbiE